MGKKREPYDVQPSCRVKLTIGHSKQRGNCTTVVQGKARLKRALATTRRIIAEDFPDGSTSVLARGSWRCGDTKTGKRVREPSIAVEIVGIPGEKKTTAYGCRAVFRKATATAKRLARALQQHAVMTTYVGSRGTSCTAFVTPSGAPRFKGRCGGLVQRGLGGGRRR